MGIIVIGAKKSFRSLYVVGTINVVDVAERLERLLREKGMSQVQLAEASGVDKQTINRIVVGRTERVRAQTAEKLAAALGIDPVALTGPRAGSATYEKWQDLVDQINEESDRVNHLAATGVITHREAADAFSTLAEGLMGIARAADAQIDLARFGGPPEPPESRTSAYRELIAALEAVDDEDRGVIIDHAQWSAERARPKIPSSNLVLFPDLDSSKDFPDPPIPIGEWIEKDTDTPRALHAWIVPVDAEAAAGVPRHEDDWLIPTTQLLNSVREVRDERTKVVKVFGDSMHPTLRSGWKVLLDPARELFRPGKIVVVYIADEGTTMGVLAQSGERYWIQKRNADYGGPMQIPLHTGAWYPVGTVTTIVEAKVEVE